MKIEVYNNTLGEWIYIHNIPAGTTFFGTAVVGGNNARLHLKLENNIVVNLETMKIWDLPGGPIQIYNFKPVPTVLVEDKS